jgi:hypothetical protein
MSEEHGELVRDCEEHTYGLVRFVKKRIHRKEDRRKMVHDYVILHRGKPESLYRDADYGKLRRNTS